MIRQGDGRGPSAGGYLSWTPRFLVQNNAYGGGDGRVSNCYDLFPGEEIGAENSVAETIAGFWDDIPCERTIHYICERTIPPKA